MSLVQGDKLNIDLPDGVRRITAVLEEYGHEAYAVGGCVRDSILGKAPGDWDITTSARPDEIKACFRRTVDTGIEHGTVTVLTDGGAYEVTTYRVDGEYKDLRHPSSVSFASRLSEDLKRRDFTVNAMAYNERTGLIDIFGGRRDLNAGIIRCVGNPDERFNEDALRILRAVRFAAQLDFAIEENTAAAIKDHAANLKAVSRERILAEISKLICSSHIEKIRDIFELGLADYISDCFNEVNAGIVLELKNKAADVQPEAAGLNKKSSGSSAFNLNESTDVKNRYARLAFLTEGMENSHVRRLIRSLKADNHTLDGASVLNRYCLRTLPYDKYELKKIMSGISPGLFEDILRLKEASRGTGLYEKHCSAEKLEKVIAAYNEIILNNEPVYLKDLAVSGSDLIKKGTKEGPEVGAELKRLLDMVHRAPELNKREVLINERL